MSKYSQLYTDQGNFIADPETGMTSLGLMSSVDACAAGCTAAGLTCQYFTFVYADGNLETSGGTCYIRAPADVSINSTLGSKQIYYKMIPTQDMAAQSLKLRFRSSAVTGQEVSNGWYMRWPVSEAESGQGFNVSSSAPSSMSTLMECLRACDMDATCTLVYYDASDVLAALPATRCLLKAAGSAARHRTAIHGISGRLVHGAPGPAGANCTVDADCQSGGCVNGTCAGFTSAPLAGKAGREE
jgi:hypothetical protein